MKNEHLAAATSKARTTQAYFLGAWSMGLGLVFFIVTMVQLGGAHRHWLHAIGLCITAVPMVLGAVMLAMIPLDDRVFHVPGAFAGNMERIAIAAAFKSSGLLDGIHTARTEWPHRVELHYTVDSEGLRYLIRTKQEGRLDLLAYWAAWRSRSRFHKALKYA